jgi:hypothetical protein
MRKLEQGDMFPKGPGSEQVPESGKSGLRRFYYVRDARKERMVGARNTEDGLGWVLYDLSDRRIHLCNCYRVAKRLALKFGGQVETYPYSTSHLHVQN